MRPRHVALSIAVIGILLTSLFGAITASGASTTSNTSDHGPVASLGAHSTAALSLASSIRGKLPAPPALVHPDLSVYVIILPDGTITGPPNPISRSGNVYSLTSAFTGSIVDERSGSTFLGGGYTITTSSVLVFGFQVNTTSNVTVKNLHIAGGTDDFEVLNSTNVLVETSTAGAGASDAFVALSSSTVTFASDYANGSTVGFYAGSSSYVDYSVDTADTDTVGFELVQVSYSLDVSDTGTGDHSGFVAELSRFVDVESGSYSTSSSVGLIFVQDSGSEAYSLVAESSQVGVEMVLCSDMGIYSSNFSKATSDGAELLYSDSVYVSEDGFGAAGSSGLYARNGAYDTFDHDVSNGSAINGFYLGNLTEVDISDSYAVHNGWNGLYAVDSQNLLTDANTFSSTTSASGNGTYVQDTSNVRLTYDTDSSEYAGIYDVGSQGLTIEYTNTSHDNYGIILYTDENPYVEYAVADNDATGVLLEAAIDGVVFYANTTSDTVGIEGIETLDNEIADSSAYKCVDGVALLTDTNSVVVNEKVTAATSFAAIVTSSLNTYLDSLQVNGATPTGVEFASSSGVALEDSNVSNTAIGFVLASTSIANISGNTFYHDTADFSISAAGLSGNVVYWNNFINGGGWKFYPAGGNPLSVVFDAGYPGGGNHWSNLTSPDMKRGPGQNVSGSDGIVDVPMPISGTYMDHYPLTHAINVANLTVTFHEVGLPTGKKWGVHFANHYPSNTTYNEIQVYYGAVAYENYSYSIYSPAGWVASPASGVVKTNGSLQSVTITFTPVTYSTTFQESGLPAGSKWTVTVDGTNYSGTTSSIVVPLGNGTHDYTVPAIPGYLVAPTHGNVTVNATKPTVTIAFTAVLYAVTFTESGLPSGTTWNVSFAGTSQTSTGATITFHVSNGSYTYKVVNVSGYTLVPFSGTQLVSGPGASITVVFTANSSTASTPGGPAAFWGLLAVVIVLAVILALLLLRGRKKPTTAPAVTGWTPPPAGEAPPPPPSWSEGGGPPPGAVAPLATR
jgi:hypothetical protein